MPSSWRRRRDRAGLAVGTMLLLLAGVGVVQGGDRVGFTAAGTVPSTPASVAPRRPRRPTATGSRRHRGAASRRAPRPPPDVPASPRRGSDPTPPSRPTGCGWRRWGWTRRSSARRSTAGVSCPCRRTRAPSAGGVPGRPRGHRWARSCWPATSTASSRAPARSTRWRGPRSAPGSSSAAPAARRRTSCRAGAATPRTPCRGGTCSGQDVEARLLLVTCGGDFDQETRHYSDNVVVYAVPLGAASPSPR